MSSRYKIVKIPTCSGWFIDDAEGDGTSIRYATKGLAERTIAAWERHEKEALIYAAEERIARLEHVNAYLAIRAARREIAARQFAFNFT
jgi:hypothetical protein